MLLKLCARWLLFDIPIRRIFDHWDCGSFVGYKGQAFVGFSVIYQGCVGPYLSVA